jgi:hypothetical protein
MACKKVVEQVLIRPLYKIKNYDNDKSSKPRSKKHQHTV